MSGHRVTSGEVAVLDWSLLGERKHTEAQAHSDRLAVDREPLPHAECRGQPTPLLDQWLLRYYVRAAYIIPAYFDL